MSGQPAGGAPAAAVVELRRFSKWYGDVVAVADRLAAQGFVPGEVGNEPGQVSGTVVRHGPGAVDRARTVAGPGFNRWLVPPAALAIHLCIGMAYGFSVFWRPLTRAINGQTPVACPAGTSLLDRLFTTSCDWLQSDVAVMYALFFVFLGSSAALFGGWLERSGPRKAAFVSTICWCGGLVISALGIYLHQLWMMWVGSGVIGGIGLGLGYISPVSTLIKWFPDRRGMATGMAIMGFGGGALIGAPLADMLMNSFRTPTTVGAWETFLVMAAIYAVFMFAGTFGYRVPPNKWSPEGWTKPAAKAGLITSQNVHLKDAHKTPQFWFIWVVLCMNVSAGIATVEPELRDVLRSLGARPLDIVMKVGIPRSLPYFFASLKVAVTVSFVGSIVSETIGANSGVGHLIIVASSRFDVPLVFAGLMATAVMGVTMYSLASVVESRMTGWATR